MNLRDICLVSSSPLASNPRLVKEADTFSAAGYVVSVISNDRVPQLRKFNAEIAQAARWEHVPLRDFGRVRSVSTSMTRKAARLIAAAGTGHAAGVADCWALSKYTGALRELVAGVPARLYVAHTLEALPAVAHAARQNAARYAFDAEDLHSEELADSPANVRERALRRRIEDTWLPGCAYVTAASPQIADVYTRRYGRAVTSVLNVFPLPDVGSRSPMSNDPKLYWFSQTIGPGRGLEEFLDIMAAMQVPVELFLQGTWAPGYRPSFERQAHRKRLMSRIHALPPCAPDTLLEMPAQYEAGLSLELDEPPHHRVCLGNKIFTYLGAGTPVIVSDTPAQEWLAGRLGKAALVVNIGNPVAAAKRIDAWLSPANMAEARRAARAAAEREFNWDHEKYKVLKLVRDVLQEPCAAS